jgi:ABC-2 type transport system ATP-binding protein
LLILDEPFSGLDPVAVQLLEDLIREASERGATILLSTHLLPQAEALCDHVLLLREGQTLASGPLQQVLAQGNPKVELRTETAPPDAVNIGDDRWIIEAQDNTIDEVFREAAQWPGVREIRRTGRQLRDFFSEDADA